MKQVLLTAAAGSLLAVSMVSDAFAYSRNTTVYGPYGSASVSAHGSCSGSSCSRSVKRTGPYGYKVKRSGTVSCGAYSCSGSRTTTTPSGRTYHRHGTIRW
ncbi:MAG: hypothetical protein AAF732_22560 [Pseudomonadota bacterium]